MKTKFLYGSSKKVVKGDELADKVWFRGMYSMLGKYKRVTVWVLHDQGIGSIGVVKN